jgi:hypothetical protein
MRSWENNIDTDIEDPHPAAKMTNDHIETLEASKHYGPSIAALRSSICYAYGSLLQV